MAVSVLEFGRDRRRERVPGSIPRTRLLRGCLVAEIIIDRRIHPAVLHCVVQRQGSSEVLFLQQFSSREEAEEAANEFMGSYPQDISREAAS